MNLAKNVAILMGSDIKSTVIFADLLPALKG